MITEQQMKTLFVQANPIPDGDMVPLDEMAAAAYLETLEQRSSNVTQLDAKQTETPTPKRSMVPWLIAAAVAAVIGVAIIISSQNTEQAPVVSQPTPTAGPVTIKTDVDLGQTPISGTFEVTVGADTLGCSSGTLVQSNTFGKLENVMTCESGPNTGTFTLVYRTEDFNWSVLESTDGFTGLQGEGRFSFVMTGASGIVETFTGDIEYTP